MGLQTEGKYTRILNARCIGDTRRCRWTALGRGSMCQTMFAIDERGRGFTWGQNYAGTQGHGDPDWISSMNWTYPDLVDIEFATQLLPNSGPWVKSDAGEYCGMIMNASGEIYIFGENMIVNDNACRAPGSPGVDYEWWTPIRVAPGMTFKDFSFDYYHAHGVNQNNRLVSWGYNINYCMGNGLPECQWSAYLEGRVYTPYENPLMVEDVKLVACEYGGDACVTVSNRVYGWGENWYEGAMWSQVPVEYTGLPSGVDVEELFAHAYGIIVRLANGEVWAVGYWGIMGDGGSSYTGVFARVDSVAAKGFCVKIHSSGNALTAYAVMEDGNVWGWGDGYYIWGNNLPEPPSYEIGLVGSDLEGEHHFVDVMNNTYQLNGALIDDHGYLWTWGSQQWGPMLAIGLNYDQVTWRPTIGLAAPPKEYYLSPQGPEVDYWSVGIGPSMSHNTLPVGESDYVQPLPQIEDHNPCGHWHVRLFEQEEEWPANCWMTSLYVRDGNVMFVACGRWLYMYPDTGNQVIILLYSIGSNTWTQIMYVEPYHAAEFPGGAFYDGDVFGFFNWKADVSGTTFNEVYSNLGMGVWIINNATGVVELTTFTDGVKMSGRDKIAVHSSGTAVVAYENAAGQMLVKVSTDFGATWVTRRTVAALGARNDFAVWMDDNGYIYLIHQIGTHYCKIEKSINNGVAWTVQDASDYKAENLQRIKFSGENGSLHTLGEGLNPDTDYGYVEWSTTDGASWNYMARGDGYTVIGHAGTLASGRRWAAFVDKSPGSHMKSYRYNDELESYKTEEVDTPRGVSSGGSMSGHNGIVVYTAYGFYTVPKPAVALMVSLDQGQHWSMRATPLKYYSDWDEITDGECNPVFVPAPPGNIEHEWNFVRSDWAETFIKQGNKW